MSFLSCYCRICCHLIIICSHGVSDCSLLPWIIDYKNILEYRLSLNPYPGKGDVVSLLLQQAGHFGPDCNISFGPVYFILLENISADYHVATFCSIEKTFEEAAEHRHDSTAVETSNSPRQFRCADLWKKYVFLYVDGRRAARVFDY